MLADHPTLNHMIGYIQRMKGGGGGTAPPAPVPAPAVPATPAPAAATVPAPVVPAGSHADIEEVLVAVVVDHTGYPADFIEMDQDLEGELGIDTVKQAEIMAEIRDRFALPVDEDFVLADHPTLNHFTAYIVKMRGGTTGTAGTEPEPTGHEAAAPVGQDRPSSHEDGTRRWQVEIEDCPGEAAPLVVSGTVVVSDDGWGIAEAFCQRMEARGLSAVRVGFESRIRTASRHDEGGRTVDRADPEQPEHLAWIAEQLKGPWWPASCTWRRSNWLPSSGPKTPIHPPKSPLLPTAGLASSRNLAERCPPTHRASWPR